MAVAISSGVKIARVVIVVQLRHESSLLTQQRVPIQPIKERMGFDFCSAGRAQSITRVLL